MNDAAHLHSTSAHLANSLQPESDQAEFDKKDKLINIRPASRLRVPPPEIPAEQRAVMAIDTALSQKGLDVRGFDVRGISSITDFIVVVSGTSERHVNGIGEKIRQRLKDVGETPRGDSDSTQWIVLDYGDLIIHVFFEPARQYYEFDNLWETAPVLELPEELKKISSRFRTGIYRW